MLLMRLCLCLVLCCGTIDSLAQVETLRDSHHLNLLIKHLKLQRVRVELNGQNHQPRTHQLNIVRLDDRTRLHTNYTDGKGNYYLHPGRFQLNLRLDTIRSIAYFHRFTVDSTELNFSYSTDSLASLLERTTPWLDRLSEGDSLTILQHNNNNWFKIEDTIQIIQQADQKIIDWTSRQFNGRSDTTLHHLQVMDLEQRKAFLFIVDRMKYPQGVQNRRIQNCGSCRGNQSLIAIQYQSFIHFFVEPQCNTNYWWKYRTQFFKAK